MDLTVAPESLSHRQRVIYWIGAAICAASRFLAMSRTLWDWDEALFCLGLRSYDVTSHHPHPPGFPVYIGAAKLLRSFIHSDFRSLQAVNLLAGVLLFPAMFLLARELRLRFETSVVAAALCAFLPNVIFFGGGAFSDVPSIALVVFAVAMLLRGCRDPKAYLIGTVALALSIGIRPQNLLVGIAPGVLATYHRARSNWRTVVAAALIGIAICAVSYGAVIYSTGSYASYMQTVRTHGEYISKVDSFRNPERPPLWRIADRFFLKQYQSPPLSVVMSLLVLVSVAGAVTSRDRRILLIALAFVPFAVAAWLMLDRYSINRFSIGYCPLFAILAADGIHRATRGRSRIEFAAGAALILAFFVWTLPALNEARSGASPTVAAVEAVKQRLDPKGDQLYVSQAMVPFMEYIAPYYPFIRVLDDRALPVGTTWRKPWLLMELDATAPRGFTFQRSHARLWNIARRHYFDVALAPVTGLPQFVSGWYAAERSGQDEWRWMGPRSVTKLPPISGEAMLRLVFDVPDEVMPQPPVITVRLNGVVLDQFTAPAAHLSRDYAVTGAPDNGVNLLELETSRALNPAQQHMGNDTRDLGILLKMLSWGPR